MQVRPSTAKGLQKNVLAIVGLLVLAGLVGLRVYGDRSRLASAMAWTEVPAAPPPETGHMRRRRQ